MFEVVDIVDILWVVVYAEVVDIVDILWTVVNV